jgi:hypothetical protein
MSFPQTPYNLESVELMTRAVEAAWQTALQSFPDLSEGDWTKMTFAVMDAFAEGERNVEQLKQAALGTLAARRGIVCNSELSSALLYRGGDA